MKSSNHCTGETIHLHKTFLSFTGRFQTLIKRLRKHIPRIYNAEEKESMTTVRSKVTSEHANLTNGGILHSKTIQNLYTKVTLMQVSI